MSAASMSETMDRVHGTKRHTLTLTILVCLLALLAPCEAFAAKERRRQHAAIRVQEVARPQEVPMGAIEVCKQVLVQHVFGNSITPVVHPYSPAVCAGHHRWTSVVLRWTASSTGHQFDRISTVWLGGVEILRTCTAEPVQQPGGIEWTVEKDVTRFSSLWKQPQLVAVELANVLSAADALTGLYDVNLSVHFYDAPDAQASTAQEGFEIAHEARAEATPAARFKSSGDAGGDARRAFADVVLPFPSPSTSPDHWMRIRDEREVHTHPMRNIPRNSYRAVLEVCVSSHALDEFWYANKPNAYFTEGAFENGPFREILVTIDAVLAGVVQPFPVIYTGGVNPFFWRPVTAIGSFVLPTYDVDITPFLANLVNSEAHIFTVAIPNALPFWLLGLNLHVWVDSQSAHTHGAILHHSSSSSTSLENMSVQGLERTFSVKKMRTLSHSGCLLSSFGNLTTEVSFSAEFSNTLTLGSVISVHQESLTERHVVVKSDERALTRRRDFFRFPLRIGMRQRVCGDGTLLQRAAIDHAWEEEREFQSRGDGGGNFFRSMKNRQQAHGLLLVPVVGASRGVAETRQRISVEGSDGCYFRSLKVGNNGSYFFDLSHTRCT